MLENDSNVHHNSQTPKWSRVVDDKHVGTIATAKFGQHHDIENTNTAETLAVKILQVPETTPNGLWQPSKKRLFSLDTTPVDRLHIPGGKLAKRSFRILVR